MYMTLQQPEVECATFDCMSNNMLSSMLLCHWSGDRNCIQPSNNNLLHISIKFAFAIHGSTWKDCWLNKNYKSWSNVTISAFDLFEVIAKSYHQLGVQMMQETWKMATIKMVFVCVSLLRGCCRLVWLL